MKRSLRKVLAFGLLLALLAAAESRAESTHDCQAKLQVIERAVQAFALAHEGEYPGSLYLLVPEYLPALPTCSGNTYAAGYRTTGDHRWFGVVCVSHDGPRPYSGLSNRDHEDGPPNHNVEACRRELLAASKPVEYYLRTRGCLPKTVSECVAKDTLAARSMAIVPLSKRDYQIICLDLHLDEEVAPLSPRFDSRSGRVGTDQLFIPKDHDVEFEVSRLSLVSLGLLVLTWLSYLAWRWDLFSPRIPERQNTSVPHLLKLKMARGRES